MQENQLQNFSRVNQVHILCDLCQNNMDNALQGRLPRVIAVGAADVDVPVLHGCAPASNKHAQEQIAALDTEGRYGRRKQGGEMRPLGQ